MRSDNVAQMVNDSQELIQQIAEQERLAEEARTARDQQTRKRAEDDGRSLRSQLLQHTEPSAIYFFLNTTHAANDENLRSTWQDEMLRNPDAPMQQLQEWNLSNLFESFWPKPNIDLAILPPYSFSLRFRFTLAQPYISKDDNAFYIVDNPIARDKVFQLPLVRASSWKGNLCSALWHAGQRKENDERTQRLFGEIRGDESGRAGRLIFFPTFFTRTSLEIINPHDRVRRIGKNPILFESVPPDARGTFTLLYVPFDRIGEDAAVTRTQVAEDLRLLAQGVRDLFRVYGFSAKKSSGFGLAHEDVSDGSLLLRSIPKSEPVTVPATTASNAVATLDQEIASFVQRFGLMAFPRWGKQELDASSWGDKRKSEYRRLRQRHPDWDERTQSWREAAPPPAPSAATEPHWPSHSFTSFAQLIEAANALVTLLMEEGAQ